MDFSTVKAITIPEGVVTKIEVGGSVIWQQPKAGITNLIDQAIFKYKQRYSLSSKKFSGNTTGTAVIIPVPVGVTNITLRFKGFTKHGSYPNIYGGTSADAFSVDFGALPVEDSNGVTTKQFTKESEISYIVFNALGTDASVFTDAIITINEEIP